MTTKAQLSYTCDHCAKTSPAVQYATKLYQRPAHHWTTPPHWVYAQLCETDDVLVSQGWNDPCQNRVSATFCSETCCDLWFAEHHVIVSEYGKLTFVVDWGEREVSKVATSDD